MSPMFRYFLGFQLAADRAGWLARQLPPVSGDLFAGLTSAEIAAMFGVIFPMGLFNVIGSLQNIESAEAEGDSYPTAPSLAVNGLGSIVASAFGSCFPTTIYIGHPGWKRLGARTGYSALNGVGIMLFCVLGLILCALAVQFILAGFAESTSGFIRPGVANPYGH